MDRWFCMGDSCHNNFYINFRINIVSIIKIEMETEKKSNELMAFICGVAGGFGLGFGICTLMPFLKSILFQ